jgi:uncharacterized protein (DUF433 family)
VTAFPVDMTSVLTGATIRQLQYWRGTGLLEPEYQRRPRSLYSFRDLLALRTVVRLRKESSLQAVRQAFANMQLLDFTEHPSSYRLVSAGKSIAIVHDDGSGTDLVKKPGQEILANMADIFSSFSTDRGRKVVDFRYPRAHLSVRYRRLGGWPTIRDTRVPFDAVVQLVADGTVSFDDVSYYYPAVTSEAVKDAVSFAEELRRTRHPQPA